MPYDGTNYKPDVVTHPSREGLIQWLEGQDAGTFYEFVDFTVCLLTQYGHSFGERRNSGVVDISDSVTWGPTEELIEIAVGRPRTFGAALSRARAAC